MWLWRLLPCLVFCCPLPASAYIRHDYGLDRMVGYVVMRNKTDTLYGTIRLKAPERQRSLLTTDFNNALELTRRDAAGHIVQQVIPCRDVYIVRVYPTETPHHDDAPYSRSLLLDDDRRGQYIDYQNINQRGQVLWKCIADGKARVFVASFEPVKTAFASTDGFCIRDSTGAIRKIRYAIFRYSGVGVFKRFINARYGTSFRRRDFVSVEAAVD